MYKKFDVQAYKEKAQESFSGADGDSNADGWGNAGGDPAMSADGWGNMTDPSMGADGYSEAAGGFADAPEYSFTITNSSTSAVTNATVTMFGGAIYTAPSGIVNYGSSSTVTITPFNGVGYWQMLQDSMVEPFTIGKIRVQCTNTSQVTQNIGVYSTNSQGSIYTEWLNMITTVNQYQFQNTISTWTGSINITKDVYLQFPMLANATPANATILITLYLKRKVNTARGLATGTVKSVGYKAPSGGLHPVMAGRGRVGTF